MGFNLWKQLRKRLRRGRRAGGWQLAVWFAAAAGIFGLSMTAAPHDAAAAAGASAGQPSIAMASGDTEGDGIAELQEQSEQLGHHRIPAVPQGLLDKLGSPDTPVTVRLKQIYICGEESTELGVLTAAQTVALLERHPGWTAVLAGDGAVVLEERVNDLSPACKESAVFGIDKEGYLSLYDGPPERNKVLRTFFQLDVDCMESSLPRDQIDALERGIRISDLDEYNSVLSSYSDFAAPAGRRAFRPSY